jgi:hypothetical protein
VRFDPLRPGLVVPPGGPSNRPPADRALWAAWAIVVLASVVVLALAR